MVEIKAVLMCRMLISFISNEGVSGSGFRILAEEMHTGCGGILHGLVSLHLLFTKMVLLKPSTNLKMQADTALQH